MIGNPLCPDPSLWRLSLIALQAHNITLHLEPLRRAVCCPGCGTKSTRIHSRYRRTARDLPWAQWPVTLMVHSRKFFCDNDQCARRIFTEPFPGVLERYAKRTVRLHKALLELAYASSAEGAARAAGWLGYLVSGDTLINWQRQESFVVHSPRVLGVDEFSLRRGQTYGAILVDLERHEPVDVLEGKEAEPLTQWLRQHPGVAILSRDRAEAYALAGRMAAPQAIQVADRFHLVRNVGDALKELLASRRRQPRRTKLAPYMTYLQHRWSEECHNGRILHNELMQRGYKGGYTQLKEVVHSWRSQEMKLSLVRQKTRAFRPWLVIRPYGRLDSSEKQELDRVLDVNPALARGHRLKEAFLQIVAQRDVQALDRWLEEAAASGLKPFQSLARGLCKDYEAVRLALMMPWSNAQCEGQNCRVKMIKRQGYGRAKFDLLRQRILHRSKIA
jgi:transposase